VDETEKLARIEALTDELAELLEGEPWMFVATGLYYSSAESDDQALELLKSAAACVFRVKARKMIGEIFR
jgi:hypothetical protein